MRIERKTYSIFELKNLHDMSEVFILIIRINKKGKLENKEFVVLGVVMSGVQQLQDTRIYI